MSSEPEQFTDLLIECEPLLDDIFARCAENAPNFGVGEECFKDSLRKSARRFLSAADSEGATELELKDFLNQLLARTEIDAQEVIDTVYVELYGTRVVDGERVSKFATYSGRGTLRGWLRTVIWHCVVDLHRASHDEVSLDEMTENVGEGYTHASFAETNLGGEDEMIEKISKDRYRKATLTSIENAFASLDAHEKLLLLCYHVESMKLREIARLVENVDSPLRGWFQRKSASREENPSSKIHESTIMRWLEKSYAKVLSAFHTELISTHALNEEEIEICVGLATEDLASSNMYKNLTVDNAQTG